MKECKDCQPVNEPEPGQVLRSKDHGHLYLVVTPEAGGHSGPRRMVCLNNGNIWSTRSLYGPASKDDFEVVNCCCKVLDL